MEMTNNHESDEMFLSHDRLLEYPIWNPSIPQEIIADHSDGTYLVSWAPTSAGISHRSPSLVKREDLLKSYPQIVQAWESNQHNKKEQAHQTEQTFANFIARFLDTNDHNHCAAAPQRGVACDQSLRPGMHRHWGELRKCETHPPDRPPVLVCKGCRVTHYAQDCRAFDRGLIMARGARVSVCEKCANMASSHGEMRSCACGSRWTCFRCREVELEGLAKAREKYVEGRCGSCAEASGEERFVEVCLLCRGWRVYVDIVEAEAIEGVE